MTNTLKHLVKLFVDETPLTSEEFNLLEQHRLVQELRPGAWQLTALGASLLKN